jgi:hypothetical protein
MKETFMGRLPEQTNSNLAMVSAACSSSIGLDLDAANRTGSR